MISRFWKMISRFWRKLMSYLVSNSSEELFERIEAHGKERRRGKRQEAATE
jgi:hypothetical protein